ncbi:MAG TPA: hypothetical protein VFP72_15445 [Kineosporiaceae bacterium]|nr:hypothetical protein [Kineosporiaceae bacterium]
MSTTPARITVPNRTHVYLAAVGSVAPVDATTAMAAAWKEVGLTTEDSLTFETSPEFKDVRSAQSDYPTRIFQTSETGTITVQLQEWSIDNFKAVFGGGQITTPSAGVFKFEPPLLGARTEIAACIEVIDGDKHYRYIIPRCLQREGVSQTLNKGSEAHLPLKLSILGGDAASAWYMLTDDPAFTPPA